MARRPPPSAEDITLGVLARLPALRGEILLDDLSLAPYGTASGPVSISPNAEQGDGRIRAPLLERIWRPSLTGAFRGIKDSLDPTGILNPGVILPLPGQDPLEGLWPRYGGAS